MAKYEPLALRIDERTRARLTALAERTGVPKTVLARRLLERQVDDAWSLFGSEEASDDH